MSIPTSKQIAARLAALEEGAVAQGAELERRTRTLERLADALSRRLDTLEHQGGVADTEAARKPTRAKKR